MEKMECDTVGIQKADDEIDVLSSVHMEGIRQNTSQYSFDHFITVLKRKDKKVLSDPTGKKALQSALEKLKEYDVQHGSELFHINASGIPTMCPNRPIPSGLTDDEKQICDEKLVMLRRDFVSLKELAIQQHNNNYIDEAYALEFMPPSIAGTMALTIPIFKIPNTEDSYSANKDRLSVTLKVERSKEKLYAFPVSSYLDSNHTWTWEPFSPQKNLSLEYVLYLSRPIVLTKANYEKISGITGITYVNLRNEVNYFRQLSNIYDLEEITGVICKTTVFDYVQRYKFAREEGTIVDAIRFVHPAVAIQALKILRDQAQFNFLLEFLFMHHNTAKNSNIDRIAEIAVSIRGENSLVLSFGGKYFVEITVERGKFSLSLNCDAITGEQEELKQRLISLLEKASSISLMMHCILAECNLDEVSIIKKQSVTVANIEQYHEFLYRERSTSDSSDCSTDLIGHNKVGQSWLSVNLKMLQNERAAMAIFSSVCNRDHQSLQLGNHRSFVVVRDDDEELTLLKAAKNIELVKELISPPPSSHTRPVHHLSRVSSVQTPSRTLSSDSALPMLSNAFHDLEAIAEIGAAEDTESQISEQSTKSSALLENCSPTAPPPQSGQIVAGAFPLQNRGRSSMSPIDQHKMNSNLYRRRLLMQQQSSGSSNLSPSTEIFDFINDDQMKQSIGNIGLNSSFNDAMTYAAIMNPPNQSPGRGKRRGRKPKVNMGDRPYCLGPLEHQSSSEFSPDSPSIFPEFASGNGRKRRGGGTPTQRGTRKPRTSKLQSATEIGINIGHPSGNQILAQQYTSLSGNQIVEQTQHILSLSNSQQFQSASTAVQHQLTNLISVKNQEDTRAPTNVFESFEDTDDECDPPRENMMPSRHQLPVTKLMLSAEEQALAAQQLNNLFMYQQAKQAAVQAQSAAVPHNPQPMPSASSSAAVAAAAQGNFPVGMAQLNYQQILTRLLSQSTAPLRSPLQQSNATSSTENFQQVEKQRRPSILSALQVPPSSTSLPLLGAYQAEDVARKMSLSHQRLTSCSNNNIVSSSRSQSAAASDPMDIEDEHAKRKLQEQLDKIKVETTRIGTYRKELERAINANKGTCDKIEGQHHENEVDEEDEQSREAETKSLIDSIYEENRRKAATSQATFAPLIGNSARISRSKAERTDAEIAEKTYQNGLKILPSLIAAMRIQRARRNELLEQQRLEYEKHRLEWEQMLAKLEASPKKMARDAKSREIYEKTFGELKKTREGRERNSRERARISLNVSDRDMNDAAPMETEERIKNEVATEDVDDRARSAAIVAPICTLPPRRFFENRNGLVVDPHQELRNHFESYHKVWAETEKAIFLEKIEVYGKNFAAIAAFLPLKTTKDCVNYYYMTKKSSNYKPKFGRKRKKKDPQYRPPIMPHFGDLNNEKQTTLFPPIGGKEIVECLICDSKIVALEATQQTHHLELFAGAELSAFKNSVNQIPICTKCNGHAEKSKVASRCPLLTCGQRTGKKKPIRTIPEKFTDLNFEHKRFLVYRLKVPPTAAKCCNSCYKRIKDDIELLEAGRLFEEVEAFRTRQPKADLTDSDGLELLRTSQTRIESLPVRGIIGNLYGGLEREESEERTPPIVVEQVSLATTTPEPMDEEMEQKIAPCPPIDKTLSGANDRMKHTESKENLDVKTITAGSSQFQFKYEPNMMESSGVISLQTSETVSTYGNEPPRKSKVPILQQQSPAFPPTNLDVISSHADVCSAILSQAGVSPSSKNAAAEFAQKLYENPAMYYYLQQMEQFASHAAPSAASSSDSLLQQLASLQQEQMSIQNQPYNQKVEEPSIRRPRAPSLPTNCPTQLETSAKNKRSWQRAKFAGGDKSPSSRGIKRKSGLATAVLPSLDSNTDAAAVVPAASHSAGTPTSFLAPTSTTVLQLESFVTNAASTSTTSESDKNDVPSDVASSLLENLSPYPQMPVVQQVATATTSFDVDNQQTTQSVDMPASLIVCNKNPVSAADFKEEQSSLALTETGEITSMSPLLQASSPKASTELLPPINTLEACYESLSSDDEGIGETKFSDENIEGSSGVELPANHERNSANFPPSKSLPDLERQQESPPTVVFYSILNLPACDDSFIECATDSRIGQTLQSKHSTLSEIKSEPVAVQFASTSSMLTMEQLQNQPPILSSASMYEDLSDDD